MSDFAAANGKLPSKKALFSSRKPRSGSSISMATPLLEAAQIIFKWHPLGSGEDAVTIVVIMVTAKVMDTMDLIMMAAALSATNATKGRTSFVTF